MMYSAELQIAPAFFTITHKALAKEVYMGTANLFDETVGAFGIKKLLGSCGKSRQLFNNPQITNILKGFNIKYDELSVERAKIKTWRKKWIAHPDNDYFLDYDKLKNEQKITTPDFLKLLEYAYEVCNELRNLLCASDMIEINTGNINDIYDLMNALKNRRADLETVGENGADIRAIDKKEGFSCPKTN